MLSIKPLPVPKRQSDDGISTVSRFLYLNTYAFLLVFGGGGIACIPLGGFSRWLILPQVFGVLLCWMGAYRIFRSWHDKKRKYRLLMTRNSVKIRPDTFKEFMQAPCGRLLVRVVLKDLHQEAAWKTLCHLQLPFRQRLQEGCRPQKTVVYIMNEEL